LQLHLVEQPRRAFRTRSEQFPRHLLDLKLQMRGERQIGGELRLRDGSVRVGQNPPFAFNDEQGSQRVNVVRKIGQASVNDPNRSTKSAICGAPILPMIQNVAGLPGCVRPARPARIAPVNRVEQITEPRRGDRDGAVRRAGPNEPAMFKTLGVKRQVDSVAPENFDHVAATPAKNEKIAGVRVAPEPFLNLQRQTVHAAPHVRHATS
jgi:hypothetical protein